MKRRLTQGALICAMFGCLLASYGVYSLSGSPALGADDRLGQRGYSLGLLRVPSACGAVGIVTSG